MAESAGIIDTFYTPQQTAALLQTTVQTLAKWRCAGDGPRFHKFGRLVRYAPSDLQAFVHACKYPQTSASPVCPALNDATS